MPAQSPDAPTPASAALVSSRDPKQPIEFDPVYRNSVRETLVIVVICLAMMTWSLVAAHFLGYGSVSPEQALEATQFGLPTWVFWSLLVPWILGLFVTAWFCFGFLVDDPLGDNDLDPHRAKAVQAQESHRAGEHAGEVE